MMEQTEDVIRSTLDLNKRLIDMCFEAEEELIYRAAKHGYWLAEYVIQ